MSLRVETVLIEPNMIVRAGLASLLKKYCCRVIASATTVSDVRDEKFSETPRLVVLGAATIDDAVAQGAICRERWPECKIMLLYDRASPEEAHKILESEADGCIPLSASQEMLEKALDLLISEEGLVMIMHAPSRMEPKDPQARKPFFGQNAGKASVSSAQVGSPASVAGGNGGVHRSSPAILDGISAPSGRGHRSPRLSERERQILDGLVCGYQNKMIARTYGITEATVKVHMKSILRKIRVVNRTQAALWAMKRNLVLDNAEKRVLEAAET